MKTILSLLFIFPAVALCFEIKTTKNGENIDLQISNVPLPVEQLQKDLKSGISTIIVSNVSFWQKDKILSKITSTFKIYYDLWDELYHLQKIIDGKSILHEKLKQNEVMASLQKLVFLSAISLQKVKGEEIYLSFAIIIDPTSKEKRNKIKKWLAQNQVSTPTGASKDSASNPSQNLAALSPNGSIKRGLFSQILDSELEDGTDSGRWSYFSPKIILPKKDYVDEK